MKIEVTAKDIKLGMGSMISNTTCPVARAFHRAGFKNVLVGVDWVSRDPYKLEQEVRLPEKVGRAIRALIYKETVEPFSFTLTKAQVKTLAPNFYRA